MASFGGQGTLECKEQDQDQATQLCRICFGTDGNLYSMKKDKNLDQAYRILTGLSIQNEDNIPPYLCPECSTQVMHCFHFRNRSLKAHLLLLEILRQHDCITLESIKHLNEDQNVNPTNLVTAQSSTDNYDIETVSNIKKEIECTDDQILINVPCSHTTFNHYNILSKKKDEYLLQEESIEEDSIPTLHEDLLAEIKAENYDAYNDEDIDCGNMARNGCSETYEGDGTSDYGILVEEKVNIENLKGNSNTTHMNSGDSHLSNGKLSCDLCSYKTDSDKNLLHHTKTHYISSKSQKHQKVKSREKRVSCNLCIKTYSTKCGLQKHMKSHNGEKPYTCDVCNKSFKENRDLQNHLRTHSGEKPFGCDLCKKSFSERGNLLRHIRIHSGVKPYSCNFCKKSYNQRHHLKRHMTKHYKVTNA